MNKVFKRLKEICLPISMIILAFINVLKVFEHETLADIFIYIGLGVLILGMVSMIIETFTRE